MSFDDDPLDLLDDDDDGVIETILLFDEDQNKQQGSGSPQPTGCSVVLILFGTITISAGLVVAKFLV